MGGSRFLLLAALLTLAVSSSHPDPQISAIPKARPVREALSAFRETQAALVALEEGRRSEALAHLTIATGKLALLAARYPERRRFPIRSEVAVVDFRGDPETVANIVEEAHWALHEGRVQKARRLLANLASELQITTNDLPLAAYSKALKRARALVERNRVEEAKAAMLATLDTLLVTETIFPLPILRAEAMVKRAAELAGGGRKGEALTFLRSAQEQLRLAEALGYGDRDRYRSLYREMAASVEEIEGRGELEGDLRHPQDRTCPSGETFQFRDLHHPQDLHPVTKAGKQAVGHLPRLQNLLRDLRRKLTRPHLRSEPPSKTAYRDAPVDRP